MCDWLLIFGNSIAYTYGALAFAYRQVLDMNVGLALLLCRHKRDLIPAVELEGGVLCYIPYNHVWNYDRIPNNLSIKICHYHTEAE
jgi:hypothetical protein